ncbi:undecaprenyl-phosphate glucose phosphotransferase [Clostridium sp. BJN0001]|uniref:undecaprenyl-phosphate glucose phosphotransferase n=1 Tax=Clostridium sp. BJN0001 TaxID=2930219 RepID=UPI001FD3DBFB|nr:undecaprenyl-phosphate glucose phosphotransferase [Clostridium sp. BJN0001]
MIKENQDFLNKLNAFTDIIFLFLSMAVAYFVRFYIFSSDAADFVKLNTYFKFCFIIVPFNLVIFHFCSLYNSFRTSLFSAEFSKIVLANTVLTGVVFSLLYILKLVDISRWVLIFFYFINILLISIKRFSLRKMLSSLRAKGFNLKHVVIVGSGNIARSYLNTIIKNRSYGYAYSGYISDSDNFTGKKLGNYKNLLNVLNKTKPDEVICALETNESEILKSVISDCEKTGTKVSIIPFCYEYIPAHPYIDQIGNIPLINVRRIPLDNFGNAILKRIIDILGSLCLIILCSPIYICTAVLIKLTSKGPIFFKQQRVGLNKKLFTMYKFRSMRVNNEETTGWTTNNDNRKTKFGSFIRKYSIDETPQFFNVLKGDMSLIGPRPEIPHFVDEFKDEIPLYMVKHQVKPGITGLAQIKGYRGDTSIKKRIEFDIYYIENWSLLMDIEILFKTAFKGFRNNETIVKGKMTNDK